MGDDGSVVAEVSRVLRFVWLCGFNIVAYLTVNLTMCSMIRLIQYDSTGFEIYS